MIAIFSSSNDVKTLFASERFRMDALNKWRMIKIDEEKKNLL